MKEANFSLTINHDGTYKTNVTHQSLPNQVVLMIFIHHDLLNPPKIAVIEENQADNPQDVSWR